MSTWTDVFSGAAYRIYRVLSSIAVDVVSAAVQQPRVSSPPRLFTPRLFLGTSIPLKV